MFQLCRDLRDASFDRFRQPKILLNSLAQSLHPHNFTHCGAWPIYYFCGILHLHRGCSIWPLIESQPVPFETQEELAYICTGASIWEAAEQAGMRSKLNQEVFVAFHGNQLMLCYTPPPPKSITGCTPGNLASCIACKGSKPAKWLGECLINILWGHLGIGNQTSSCIQFGRNSCNQLS